MFISFEGVEGVGKTTLIDALQSYLHAQSVDFVATREPGGTALAEQIRSLLLSANPDTHEAIVPMSELLLVFAARAQHIAHVIMPALAAGKLVICDRFVDASVAYQSGGRGLDRAVVQQLIDVSVPVMPTLTFLLDLPVAQGLARAANRAKLDRFEQEQQDFFERVRQAYLHEAVQSPERMVVVDASQSPEQILNEVLTVMRHKGVINV